MDGCSLLALIACFSWTNLYIDGGLQFQDIGQRRMEWISRTNHEGSAIETVTTLEPVDDPYNPYGRLALGYQIEFKSITLSLEAAHTSSLETNTDRGVNSVGLRMRWYPFR